MTVTITPPEHYPVQAHNEMPGVDVRAHVADGTMLDLAHRQAVDLGIQLVAAADGSGHRPDPGLDLTLVTATRALLVEVARQGLLADLSTSYDEWAHVHGYPQDGDPDAIADAMRNPVRPLQEVTR